jgi:hypothetical protein
MKTPQEKYLNDPAYRQMVDAMEGFIHAAMMSPAEIRECAMLACIHHEMRHPPAPLPEEVLVHLRALEEFRRRDQEKP